MLRKQMVSEKLDQLQLVVDRLKSSLVIPTDPGDVGTPTEVILQHQLSYSISTKDLL